MTKGISKLLFFNLLKTFLISSFLVFAFYLAQQTSQTETFEGKQGDFIEALAGIFWILCLTISALTIYLNLIKPIRENKIFCLLSFLALPVMVTLAVLFWDGNMGTWDSFYVYTIIFFLIHTFFFLQFLKQKR